MKTVVVGLSGGVDSSVAAYLLQKEGYNVIGIFMKNWHDDSVTISDDCPWIDDSQDALLVAQKLGIPFQTIDLSEQYKEKIVDYMFAEYESGRTPNPDVLCNREIKFDVFMKTAMDLGADYVATGHYCRKGETESGEFQLLAGKDDNKDQSYFLCQLTQQQLSKSLFPIGEMQKSRVREIAKEADLITADKKDSQGLCFIGKVKLPTFLQQQLQPKEGNIIEIPADLPQLVAYESKINTGDASALATSFVFEESMGINKGKHQGAHYFTIGQRKGLGVGGTPLPLFIIQTNTKTNSVYVGQGNTHPALNKQALFITEEDIHWVRPELKMVFDHENDTNNRKDFSVRIRYRQDLEKATLIKVENGMYILFDNLQMGISPGQFAAWYTDDELIGSGVIAH